VEAALTSGAVSVAVATGQFTEAELEAAGAHVVLTDLTDPLPAARGAEGLTEAVPRPGDGT
jgi:phosphoglycolate phosphatase-like HAD superfamily hydrolase